MMKWLKTSAGVKKIGNAKEKSKAIRKLHSSVIFVSADAGSTI